MGTYIYEAKYTHVDDGYTLYFPDLPDAFTQADNMKQLAKRAVDVLQLTVAEYLEDGIVLPKPTFSDEPQMIVACEVTDETIALTKCMTVQQAADELGITKSRVSQMLTRGQLEPYQNGGIRMVTIASVNKRKLTEHKAGRPSKA